MTILAIHDIISVINDIIGVHFMTFNPTVFERLLFPLNKRVYRQIQETIDIFEDKHPGKLQQIVNNFENAACSDTQTPVWRPGKESETKYPSIDVSIVYEPILNPKISVLHKVINFKIGFDYEEKLPSEYKGSHLVVGFYHGKRLNSFIVPLEYLLGFNEKAILKDGSYQLYSHTILSPDNQAMINSQLEAINENGNYDKLSSVQQLHQKNYLIYVGITKRTWQERYRQHCMAMGHGSNLLFHRALRGEFCQIGIIEHIVERAGLTENQAMEIEEKEVEKRSLHSLHPKGLNMIPGGYAGLKYIHNFASRTGYNLDKMLSSDDLENILVDVQRQSLKNHFKTDVIERVNNELRKLWAEDIDFRIKATTGQHNRFSYQQIKAARIWHSSGWSNAKILDYLQKMDSKKISMDQLERLLKGETYASIPDVLI